MAEDEFGDIGEDVYDQRDLHFLASENRTYAGREICRKKTYYPTQEYLANILVNRMKSILWLYSKKKLSDFKKFDFQIYTARFCMLEEQTMHRLLDPHAACFSRHLYNDFDKLTKQAKMRVSKYQALKEEITRSKQLQEKAKNEPDTLFLIVADEAHWGVSKAGKDSGDSQQSRTGANDQLVNCWTNDQPNVIVLLVTATPINLKTDESRLQNQQAVILKMNNDSEKRKGFLDRLQLVERKRNIYVNSDDPRKTYQKAEIESEFNLHNVKWSEAQIDKLAEGVVFELKVPSQKGDTCYWLAMSQQPTNQVYSLEMTVDDTQCLKLLITGDREHGLEIKSEDGSYQLVVVQVEENGIKKTKLGFLSLNEPYQIAGIKVVSRHFSLEMDGGEDVFVICVKLEGDVSTRYFKHDWKNRTFVLDRPPPSVNGLATYPLEYSFLVHSSSSPAHTSASFKPTKCYVSLNYYFNSMRNQKLHQKLIRSDENLLSWIGKKSKAVSCPDYEYLIADYSYFILLINCIRKCKSFSVQSINALFEKPSEALGQFTETRNRKLKAFIEGLEGYEHKTQLRVIHLEPFDQIKEYYAKDCLDKLDSQYKFNSQPDLVVKDLLRCLLFLDFEEKDVLEKWNAVYKRFLETEKGVQDEVNNCFTQITNEVFAEMKDNILNNYETYRIVNMVVLPNGQEQNGKMVVIRMPRSEGSKVPPGNVLYATLVLAREISSQENESEHFQFEIVRDFGKYKVSEISKDVRHPQYRMYRKLQPSVCQYRDKTTLEACTGFDGKRCDKYEVRDSSLICTNCRHMHHEINCYEHLDTLPCFLILVSKGRLGDTFPETFSAMDCRLVYAKMPLLSTLMQEFGRLCRYQNLLRGDSPPYVLVGSCLHKTLLTALTKYATFRGYFIETGSIDGYISRKKAAEDAMDELPSTATKTRKSHADHGNKEKHNFRILFEAEPQIGKTGVYLKTISLLRQTIEEKDEWVEYDKYSTTMSDDEDDHEESREIPNTTHMTNELAEKWKYPYWKDLEDVKLKDVNAFVGKYARTKGSKLMPSNHSSGNIINERSNSDASNGVIFQPDTYCAYRYDDPKHSLCRLCLPDVESIRQLYRLENWDINISIPATKRYLPFLRRADLVDRVVDSCPMSQDQLLPEADDEDDRTLKTWIVTPSYRRFRDATLNYRHTMVTEGSRKKCNFQHFIFVRLSEFETYCNFWEKTHVIVSLPNEMEIDDRKVTAEEGGIGYCRLFIQRFARHFDQMFIFMIDDNVSSVHEVSVAYDETHHDYCVIRKERNLEMTNVPLFKVLKHMESQFEYSTCPLDLEKVGDYSPYPDESLKDFERYTGPKERYGILGMLRERKGILRVKRPFKKTHVYALVLINLQALGGADVEYKPLICREDIQLNMECEKGGLYVCKYNRFMVRKLHLHSDIASALFCWADDIIMSFTITHEASKSLFLLYRWICKEMLPGRVELYPESNCASPELRHYFDLWKCNYHSGHHHLVIFVGNDIKTLMTYFKDTAGIGGFDHHLVMLTKDFCKKYTLNKKCNFEQHLVQELFREFSVFEIYSSHNVEKYDVPYILLYVRGRLCMPKDEDSVKNVKVPPRKSKNSSNEEELDFKTETNVTVNNEERMDFETATDTTVNNEEEMDFETETNMTVNDDHGRPVNLNDKDRIGSQSSTERKQEYGTPVGSHLDNSQIELNCDMFEVYNHRTKKTSPLKSGTKLLKCDMIRLKPEHQDKWMNKNRLDEFMKKYKITKKR